MINEAALNQLRLSKEGFSNHLGKACVAGFLWKCAQPRSSPQAAKVEQGGLQQPIVQGIRRMSLGIYIIKPDKEAHRSSPQAEKVERGGLQQENVQGILCTMSLETYTTRANKETQRSSPQAEKVDQGGLQQPLVQGIFCTMSVGICITTPNRI